MPVIYCMIRTRGDDLTIISLSLKHDYFVCCITTAKRRDCISSTQERDTIIKRVLTKSEDWNACYNYSTCYSCWVESMHCCSSQPIANPPMVINCTFLFQPILAYLHTVSCSVFSRLHYHYCVTRAKRANVIGDNHCRAILSMKLSPHYTSCIHNHHSLYSKT